MANKMTYAQALTIAIETVREANVETEVIERLEALLDKTSKTVKSKAQIEKENLNEKLKDKIEALMCDGERRTATEIANAVEGIESCSKATYLLTQLCKEGRITRGEEKRKPFYVLSEEE